MTRLHAAALAAALLIFGAGIAAAQQPSTDWRSLAQVVRQQRDNANQTRDDLAAEKTLLLQEMQKREADWMAYSKPLWQPAEAAPAAPASAPAPPADPGKIGLPPVPGTPGQ